MQCHGKITKSINNGNKNKAQMQSTSKNERRANRPPQNYEQIKCKVIVIAVSNCKWQQLAK